VVYEIRNDAFRSVMRQSPGFFNSARTGELMQTVTSQTSVVQRNAMLLVQTIAQRPVAIIAILVPIFAKDWFFALMSLVVFPLCLLPILRLGKRVRKVGAQEEYDSRALMSVMQETFSGIRLVKAYCREDHETAKFDRTNLSMTRNMVKWAKALELIGPIVETVASLAIAAGLVYAWKRGIEAEDFFLLVVALTQIYPPVKELSRVQLFLQKTTVAAEMVFEILHREPDIKDAPDAARLGRVKGAIAFNDVTFHYRDAHGSRVDPPAARGITLSLEPGKFYAVVGPSAAGKSTLFNLMLRFYDPDSGCITLDGTDIKTISQASLRENIGLVSQDTFIFHDTLRENIRYGRLDATEEQIIAAAKKAHAHEFIMQIKEGYEASVGEGGRNLSGGQKQRLSIARAILHDAPVLLLDEATSALDTESEKVIQDAIHTLSEGKTVIAIAHRLSTVLAAHQIIVMDAGRVVAVGSNEELLRTSPLYQRLHSLQFGSEEAAATA
jgi:subfamily B ATP-binding cassette protein MsbA